MEKLNISRLEEILLKHMKHLKALAETAEKKKDLIIANRVELLEEVMNDEGYIIAQIQEIEKSRLSVLTDMSSEEIDFTKMKLPEIAEKCEASDKARLLKLHAAIKTLANDAKKKNERNQDLLAFAVEYFNDFFQTLFEHQNPPNVYTQKGKQKEKIKTATMFLDKRA